MTALYSRFLPSNLAFSYILPLSNVYKPKALAASRYCHVIITISNSMNSTARRKEENTGK
jgi:hypothetical protein